MKKPTHAEKLVIWRKRRDLIRSLKDKGLSLSEIGERVGCSKQRVHQLLTRATA